MEACFKSILDASGVDVRMTGHWLDLHERFRREQASLRDICQHEVRVACNTATELLAAPGIERSREVRFQVSRELRELLRREDDYYFLIGVLPVHMQLADALRPFRVRCDTDVGAVTVQW